MIVLPDGTKRRLKTTEMFFYLAFSVILNSLANGLTIATHLGSAVWTASAVNLETQISWNLSLILLVYAIVVQILNVIIRRHIVWSLVLSNMLFALCFSYLVQAGNQLFTWIGVAQLAFGWRLMLDLIGICFIATAVSIYQRVNVMLHPNDEFSYLLRFRFFHGNAALGQIVSYVIPVCIMGYCWLKSGQLHAVGIGTLFALVCQGLIIGWADRHVFARLQHRFKQQKTGQLSS
ncbi:hypothetical protein MOO45_07035 [Bombilactobacillus folatiphilus]|uniref:Sugar specific permease n=1 Tax=Bombilactobacillus folatiphilus TaxID=2923362 RepID=A0ABY4P8S9_9LACO|nr:hypothetical protein [Bombilactobacillus folatiphilus]UQS81936.1 hypothetical protein MOO45_07035 [Bombilactobacillus folatiphilus]